MKIVVLGNRSKNQLNYYIWKEAIDNNAIEYISDVFSKNHAYYIWKARKHIVINKLNGLIKPSIYQNRYRIEDSRLKRLFTYKIPQDTDIAILSHISLCNIGKRSLIKTKSGKCRVILFLHDPINQLSNNYQNMINDYRQSGLIDEIYSFDKEDCTKYNFKYCEQIYSPPTVETPQQTEYDIYFAGRDKGRYEVLNKLAVKFTEHNIKCLFRIPKLRGAKRSVFSHLLHEDFKEKMISYDLSIAEMITANCIFDLVQDNQYGLSWRIIEALYYNKKLITNNVSILSNKYYDPRYMQYFEKIEDIDFDWIKNRVSVNYNYQNDYSATKFINSLLEDI